jgi:hypothetical protein
MGDDVILCQITSRPNRLITADEGIIAYRAGQITTGKLSEILDELIHFL